MLVEDLGFLSQAPAAFPPPALFTGELIDAARGLWRIFLSLKLAHLAGQLMRGYLPRRRMVLLARYVDFFPKNGNILRRRDPQLDLRSSYFKHFNLNIVRDEKR